ncbi:tyrosine-type recombinase/integrase [Schlesneria paludicola]|uniref:tyrosine-type recombinase/integrase n=1 Tax=Schlesneria paludicola TaxID=360056 RepID=UPI00029A2AAD|nr:tyrosine-type recombinase/integrase [Schlesneria paludicola]
MDKKAWVHQIKSQVAKYGEDKASWYCTWNDPEGKRCTKSCGPGKIGKSAANKLADKTHAELVTGTYQSKSKKTWARLLADYKEKILSRMDGPSRMAAEIALNNFQRVAKPNSVTAINPAKIDDFVTKRLKESASKGQSAESAKKKERPTVSPATVNKELRYVRAILNIAEEWKYIAAAPKVRMLKLQKKLPTFMPPEHFTAIYVACDFAKRPSRVPNIAPAIWWRGLLTTAYMTGWRISQLLSLKWTDIDLEQGYAVTRAEVEGNKGKRDDRIPLHEIVITHLRPLAASFDEYVFPWNQNRRDLWPEFQAIQAAAKLADESPLPLGGKNGKPYGFHDVRRGFATMNAESMDLFELQGLMQHKSLETTREYVNMARRYNSKVKNLFVPPNLKAGETG